MNMPCSSCHRLFSGVYAFDRHYLRREDRCKTEGELRQAGLTTDMHGVWVRDLPGQSKLLDLRKLPPTRTASNMRSTLVTALRCVPSSVSLKVVPGPGESL